MTRNKRGRIRGEAVTARLPAPAGGVQLQTFIPWTLVMRGCRKEVITPDEPLQFVEDAQREWHPRGAPAETPLLRALGLALYWQRLLDEGRFGSLSDVAAAEHLDLGRSSRIVRLTRLAPHIIEAIAAGNAECITLDALGRQALPISWDKQRRQVIPG